MNKHVRFASLQMVLLWLLVSPGGMAQPRITGFTPAAGYPSNTIIISGSGFDATLSNNVVYFSTVKGYILDARTNRLVVSMPAGAGYGPIAVTNKASNLTGYSNTAFNPTFYNPYGAGLQTSTYTLQGNMTSGQNPLAVAMGDFDNDNRADMAVVNANSNTVSVYQNISSVGSGLTAYFSTKTDLVTGSNPTAVAVGDVNGDGLPDLVVVSSGSGILSVFRSYGTTGSISSSSFAPRVDFATGVNSSSVAIGDLNLDGKVDLVVTNEASHTLSVLKNISTSGLFTTGSFAPAVDFPTDSFPHYTVLSDIDGDGKQDIIVANQHSKNVSVFHNTTVEGVTTPLSFANRVDFPTGGIYNFSVCTADLDGDGKSDLAVTNSLSNTVSVLRNTATPGSITPSSLAQKVDLPTGANPYFITVRDADGDGKPDLVTANQGASTISVLRNIATAGSITASSFAEKTDFRISTNARPVGVAINDLDGDGIPEIMSVNAATSTISLLKLSPASTAPSIDSFTPVSGPVGSQVNISGTNFNATPANNTVYLGNVKAPVTGGTATSLTVTVPAGTAYAPVTVLNNTTGLAASSSKPFTTTFANPFGTGIPANYYLPAFSVFQGNYKQIVVGDLDRDGKIDVVVAGSAGLAIYRNTSTLGTITARSFSSPVSLTNSEMTDIALGDIDGDGKIDIVSVSGTQTTSVWKNNSIPDSISAASFIKTDFLASYYPFSVRVSDLDGDGKPEIVTATEPSYSITILRNICKPGVVDASSFAAPFDMRIGGGPFAISDLDGDGRPELITSGNGIAVSRNLSNPGSLSASSFGTSMVLNGSGYGYGLIAGDIDGDGKTDIIYTDFGSNTAYVQRNASTAGSLTSSSFALPVGFPLGGNANYTVSLAINDLDGDGKPDLVSSSANSVFVLRNTSGAGSITGSSFAAGVRFSVGTGAVATADLDGDGIPEIVTSIGLSILRINNTAQQPIITSFTPASGPAGSTVVINGSNFNTTAASNIVYFGAVKATVTAGSATSLTVVVPAGATHSPVSVLNRGNSLIGYSTNPFNITFTNPVGGGAIPATLYKQKVDFPSGILPYQVALGDMDGDGKTDMVVVNENAHTVSVLINRSPAGTINDSSFALRFDLPVGTDPRAVAIGDLNMDGRPDIAVANAASSTVTVFTYLGFGSSPNQAPFYYKGEYATGASPYSVAIGDVDRDGQPDIITANLSAGTISVLRNTYTFNNLGTPSFAQKIDYAAGSYPRAVAVSDLDGDGKADIAVTNERSSTVSVLRNTSGLPGSLNASSLAPMVSFATGSSPSSITTSDVDGDGKPDLIVCNYSSNTVSVLRNMATAGNLSFAAKIDFGTGAQPFFVTAAEADGDGKPDLVTVNSSSNTVSVLRNVSLTGSITAASFDAKADFATGGYPVGVAAGDLDGDGITELLVASAATNAVSVLSVSSPGHPLVTSFSPDRGPAGTTLTITGANFNAVPANNTVYFGAVKAPVTSGTTTRLSVSVPAGATYQPVTVLDNARGLTGYSSKPFMTTFTNPFGSGIPAGFYRPRVDFPLSGPFTYAIAFGDIDGDGKPDMVAVNENAGTVSVLRNTTAINNIDAASFEARVDISTARAPRSVAITDLDGDGKPDIIVGSPASYTITILRNATGPGVINASQFTRTDLTSGAYVSAFAVGDLDDDGRPDLVVTNPYSNTLSVRRNLSAAGNLSFAAPVNFGTGSFPRAVTVTDVDGDGKLDLVVANEQSNSVSVLRNMSRPGYIDVSSFASKVDFPAAVHPPALAAGDVDGDGKPDLVVAGYDSSSLSVLHNTSTPGSITAASFAPVVNFTTGSNPYAVAIGDADGDGKADLITANSTANTVSVLRNTGTAGSLNASSFAGKADFGAGGYPLHVALGDLDGDGIAELGMANAGSGAVSVLKIDGAAAMTAASRGKLSASREQPGGDGMQLFPNPTDGAFTLQLQMKSTAVRVELVNESGTVVEQKVVNTTGSTTLLHLTLRHQPAGVYYVKATGVNGVQITQVIKR